MKKMRTALLSAGIPTLILLILVVALLFVISKLREYDRGVKMGKESDFRQLDRMAVPDQTVFIGDSITEGYPLGEFYADFCVGTGQRLYNRGISGECSDATLARFEAHAAGLRPRNIVLLIGTNDLNSGVPPQTIVSNIAQIIECCQRVSPDTNFVLLALLPVHENMADIAGRVMVGSRTNADIAQVNAELSRIAEAYGVSFVDLTEALADGNGQLNLSYTRDGLHINAQGYEVATRFILPVLK